MTLSELAQRLQDLYEQDYTTGNEFFTLDDWKFQISTTYSELLNVMYQAERRANKTQDGFSNIEIPASWLVEEDAKIEKDEAKNRYSTKTKYPVYSFDWDNAANALQEIFHVNSPCRKTPCQYRKLSLHERKFLHILPVINDRIFYYLNSANEIIYPNANGCELIRIQYVPSVSSLDDDCLLSDNIASIITDQVLKRMFQAKNGNFVPKLDDQNPNVVPQQQINPNVGK